METTEISTRKLAIKAGLLTFAGFVVYFMFMNYMNLLQIIELRVLNFFILSGGIFFAFRYYKSVTKKKFEYLQGLIFGCTISAVSLVLFALFAGLYFSQIDPLLLMQLKNNAPMMGAYITPFTVVITIMIEGMCSGLIISFALMQFYQNDATHS
ncbi:MAG: hypothetical protein Q8M15_00590 [Bacteroidota bacterium]|nr:hypothetical protein [Bacteroidota bacterium]